MLGIELMALWMLGKCFPALKQFLLTFHKGKGGKEEGTNSLAWWYTLHACSSNYSEERLRSGVKGQSGEHRLIYNSNLPSNDRPHVVKGESAEPVLESCDTWPSFLLTQWWPYYVSSFSGPVSFSMKWGRSKSRSLFNDQLKQMIWPQIYLFNKVYFFIKN
jgi:hypothetical protein